MDGLSFRLLNPDEIEVRIARINSYYVKLLLYKDARVDMALLDETVGPMNWKREHGRDNANCTVSIWDDEKKQWISKEDVGTESYTEAQKGLASDSFKRACFNWGLGRELYTAPDISFPAGDCEIKEGNKCYDRFVVTRIEYDERRIKSVTILNTNTGVARDFSNNAKPTARKQKTSTKPKAETIGKKAAEALKKVIESNGFHVDSVMENYKVSNLSDMTPEQKAECIAFIQRAKETADGNNGKAG